MAKSELGWHLLMRKVSGRALFGFQDKMNGGQRRASQRHALSGETKANKPVNGNPKFPRKSPSQTHAHGGVGFGSRAVPHRQRSSGARLAAEEYTIITIHASPFPQFPSSSDKYSVVAIRWLHESDRGSKRAGPIGSRNACHRREFPRGILCI